MYCNYETPEGERCGLELQLAASAIISLASESTVIMKVIKKYLLPLSVANVTADGTAPVFVNGRYVGNTPRRDDILAIVRRLRRSGQCAKDVSVSCNARGVVHVSTTAGRACRPLIIVENGKLKGVNESIISFSGLCASGTVEYIDCEEMDGMLIAFNPEDITLQHTHCEISPTLMNGISAATIPYSNNNPSARNCYQSSMGKQAMGVPYSNFQTRFDHMNVLQYPQRPLVSTKLADEYGMHDLPSGQNAVVCIMSFSGFGQEDSIIVNQSALDRGWGRADKYRTTFESLSTTTTDDVARFAKPSKTRKAGRYDKLDDDGIVRRFSRVTTKDCLIGKQIEKSALGTATTTKDTSVMSDINGVVEDVIMFQQRNGISGLKVKTRALKIPEIGDKFSSR